MKTEQALAGLFGNNCTWLPGSNQSVKQMECFTELVKQVLKQRLTFQQVSHAGGEYVDVEVRFDNDVIASFTVD
jgi:hypothetical protein